MDQSKNSMRSVHFFQLLSFSPLLSLPLPRQHSLLSTQALIAEDCCGEQGKAKDPQEILGPPSTPSKPEPDKSSLDSGSLGWVFWFMELGNTPRAQERLGRRQFSMRLNLTASMVPQPWWPSPGWVTTPLPGPSPPPAWLTNNMAPPPSSPAFCDGCQRWDNLLSAKPEPTRVRPSHKHHTSPSPAFRDT